MKIQSVSNYLFPRRKNIVFALFFAFSFFFTYAIPQTLGANEAPPSTNATPSDANSTSPGLNSLPAFTGKSVESAKDKGIGACINNPGKCLSDSLKGVALGVLTMEAALANAAAGLFVWMLNPESFKLIMTNPVNYEIWKIVRDTMNMLFILVLLFSAFATIYQIDKYKYNKILWTVILMALLVNFSWPISLTIIDFFSSMMYFFVQSVFHSSGPEVVSSYLGGSELKNIFLPKEATAEWPQIFIAIIVMFIFAMTLLVLSLMMLIRLVALPILAMFSPIGFAGMAAPFTQSFAKKWWDNLFKYASYGPIAVFAVLVAVRVLEQSQKLKSGIYASMSSMSVGKGDITTDMLAALVYFAIPIVLFWMAITSAEKMSSELSSSATKYGMRFGKWAGRQPWRGAKAGARWTGVPGGVQQAWKNRKGLFGSDSRLAREAREDSIARTLAGGGSVGRENARDDAKSKRIAAEQERLKRLGNVSTAHTQLANGNADQKAAAALYIADKKAFKDATELNSALKAVGGDLSAASKILDGASDSVLEESGALVKVMNTLKNNNLHHMQGAAVAKFTKDGLGTSAADYAAVLASFDDGSVAGSPGSAANQRRIEELKKKYNKQLASEGRSHIQVEHRVNEMNASTDPAIMALSAKQRRDKVYEEVFNKMSMDNIVKQDAASLKDAQFMDYLKNTKAKTKEARKQLIGAANRYGTSADVTAAWDANNIKAS